MAQAEESARAGDELSCTLRTVPVSRPLAWLSAGMRDLALAPGPSLLHGLVVAVAGIAITMLSGSGNAEIGSAMTLNSITAVVIGGTALSGGVGGVAGPMLGAITLGFIQNIISFADIDTWWETFAKASIIVLALATPGVINLFRRRRP